VFVSKIAELDLKGNERLSAFNFSIKIRYAREKIIIKNLTIRGRDKFFMF